MYSANLCVATWINAHRNNSTALIRGGKMKNALGANIANQTAAIKIQLE